MILKTIPKEPPQEHPTTRTSTHTRKATKPPQVTQAQQAQPAANAAKPRARKGRCHPKGYTPTGPANTSEHGAGIVSVV